mmetsp:Transcript_40716/g.93623  ORF Transcript_40716/g.93623 Transcript_40716/m.93623 type:complete len:235 (-) Transcript_40716:3884-4588(-)
MSRGISNSGKALPLTRTFHAVSSASRSTHQGLLLPSRSHHGTVLVCTPSKSVNFLVTILFEGLKLRETSTRPPVFCSCFSPQSTTVGWAPRPCSTLSAISSSPWLIETVPECATSIDVCSKMRFLAGMLGFAIGLSGTAATSTSHKLSADAEGLSSWILTMLPTKPALLRQGTTIESPSPPPALPCPHICEPTYTENGSSRDPQQSARFVTLIPITLVFCCKSTAHHGFASRSV